MHRQKRLDRRTYLITLVPIFVLLIALLASIVELVGAYVNVGRWTTPKSKTYVHNGWNLRQTRSRSIFQSPLWVTSLSKASDLRSTANFEAETTTTTAVAEAASRTLGSQELLMLPRQYSIGKSTFPQMNHVSCVILKCGSPSNDEASIINISTLRQAIDMVIGTHPLLSSRVAGDGEPIQRIDALQMVRSSGLRSMNEPEPKPLTFVSGMPFTSHDVLKVMESDNDPNSFERNWQQSFIKHLDNGDWCNTTTGPLWKIELHQSFDRAALLLAFNHAISDQSSAHRLIDQMIRYMAEMEESGGQVINPVDKQEMPVTVEDSVLGPNRRWSDVETNGWTFATIKYVASKAMEGFKNPVILPDYSLDSDISTSSNNPFDALTIISGNAAGGQDGESSRRRSMVQFRSLSKDRTGKLLSQCHSNGVAMSNALTAAMTYTASDFICSNQKTDNSGKYVKRNYKILQSLDMRRFGAQLDKGETVACMAGSHDLIHGPITDGSGAKLRENPSQRRQQFFWDLAREGKAQTLEFIDSDGPAQAVRVFDFAMTISDLNNLVHLTSQSKATKGRAYSAGVTNAGVYETQQAFRIAGESSRRPLQIKHGRFEVEDVYFATPHVTSGCLHQVSVVTVNGSMKFTFHPVDPIVNAATSEKFADAFVELLETITEDPVPHVEDPSHSIQGVLQALPTVVASLGFVSVMTHASAWLAFFSSVSEMKGNIADPADFWSALNFWIFFAVGHPILQPILWISDVLHGSPGPMVAGLVPATFILGNIVAIVAFTISKEIRDAVNIAALAAFFSYIGAGLDGSGGLGDFNLALDDSYKGQIVKGCPAYNDVRQESMNNFNLEKYQGLWYEQKFHDWTQFKEVYDTTLDIRLTEGGRGWIDDFGVKGPAPDAAPLSWDKSPVANGAHYFLFGRVDPNDPKGILRESGFGVEFPNYIVDVKTGANGEYTEAIQFQCLERGGVRVFEGINFMSRSPTMTDDEMANMHSRAEKAGMYPYGASPQQMHTVARRPIDAPAIDNSWQAMWRAIGVDKLLELLTKSIEDGGR